ncbi:MAG: response regulator [Spirochaetae bacterium HGW-Spirochaetae-5]|nr:MAG: response regulator [Spirochaetae bacterium HGW-Spirochaetae-5]
MGRKVVVVDDNLNNLLLEKDLLEIAGFEVFEADNAADAIALVKEHNPVVIVMDVRLPDIRGTEVARILQQDKGTRDIPIVFVTASVLADGRLEIDSIPNSGFISKPINTRTFVQEIMKFIK